MTRANALRLAFGAAIALGVLFDQPATSASVERGAETEVASEAIRSDDVAEAAILEAAVAREETCRESARAERVRRAEVRRTRRL